MYATANVTQKNAVWNLSRVSHKQITKPYEYVYDSAGATKGVCVSYFASTSDGNADRGIS